MKFIHISDVHLGKKPDSEYKWSKDREEEIFSTFEDIINICNSESIDLLLIAGELFDKQPVLGDLVRVNELFKGLFWTKVVLIAGSKDYLATTSNYNTFCWNENVYMIKDAKVLCVWLKEINTKVYGFSFDEKHVNEHICDELDNCDESCINIFIGYGGDDRYAPVNFDKLISFGYDYVAYGRRHNYEVIKDKVVYSGSPEPLDSNETGTHGYVLGNIIGHECVYELLSASRRQYIESNVKVEPSMSEEALLENLDIMMTQQGRNNIYTISIDGYRDAEINFEFDSLFRDYNIIAINDNSLPNYDFQLMYEQNMDNLLGKFINNINQSDVEEEIKKKALYLGVESLIKQQ